MKTKIIIAIAIAYTFAGCRKETIRVPYHPEPTVGQIYKELGDPVQVFTIDAGSYQMITGAKGIKVQINPNSFVYPNNQPVTGSVKIELREMLTKRDMIVNNVPSTSEGKPLISGGEFYIRATQGSVELKLASKQSLYVRVPILNPNAPTMQKYYSKGFENGQDWVAAPDTTPLPQRIDSVSSGGGYVYLNEFKFDSLGWGNCDRLYSSPNPRTPISVTLDPDFDVNNTMIWICFNQINVSAPMYGFLNPALFTFGQIPIGTQATFVVISKIRDQYYFMKKSTTIITDHKENFLPIKTTKEQIQVELNKL